MGHVTLNQLVESRFATQWGSTTPIKYENVSFTPPDGSAWVALSVRESDSQKITLGSGAQVRRTIGTIHVEIFTPLGAGSLLARTHADSVKTIFRDYRISGLHTYGDGDVYIRGEVYYTNSGTGVPATSQWFQAVCSIPFRYDVTI